jgi:hypothetical protein
MSLTERGTENDIKESIQGAHSHVQHPLGAAVKFRLGVGTLKSNKWGWGNLPSNVGLGNE